MAISEGYNRYAATLEELLAAGGLLSSSSPHATAQTALPGGVPAPHRAEIYDRVIDRYLGAYIAEYGQLPDADRALTLIVGPPGAGKSSALAAAATRGLDLSGTLMLERDELMRLLLGELAASEDLPVPAELTEGIDGIAVVPAESLPIRPCGAQVEMNRTAVCSSRTPSSSRNSPRRESASRSRSAKTSPTTWMRSASSGRRRTARSRTT